MRAPSPAEIHAETHHKRPRTERAEPALPVLPLLPALPTLPSLHALPVLGVLGVYDGDSHAPPSASKSCAEVDLLEDLYGQDAHRHNDPFQGLCV